MRIKRPAGINAPILCPYTLISRSVNQSYISTILITTVNVSQYLTGHFVHLLITTNDCPAGIYLLKVNNSISRIYIADFEHAIAGWDNHLFNFMLVYEYL